MTQSKRAVVGPKEEEALKRAEALREAGIKAFGDPNQKISIEEEMNLHLQNTIADPGDPMTHPDSAPSPGDVTPSQPQTEIPGTRIPKLDNEDPHKRLEQLHSALKEISDNPPSVQQLVSWKQIHGDLFLLWLDESVVFIYRYIKNQEWIQMLAKGDVDNMRPDQINDMIFDRCVLWPTVDQGIKAGFPAGLISTVVEQIRIRSCFLDPGQVINFTMKI